MCALFGARHARAASRSVTSTWDLAGEKYEPVCRSAGLEHVPDGLGKLAGDLDTSDLHAALAAETSLGPFVVLLVGIVVRGMRRGLDERPTEVLWSVLH